jgi:hypothetical protein
MTAWKWVRLMGSKSETITGAYLVSQGDVGDWNTSAALDVGATPRQATSSVGIN